MATSSAAIQILSKATGIKLVTLGHTARILREKGKLWPRSVKGGGKNAVHVEAADLANLVLALAGTQPSDGPSVVAQLGVARWSGKRRKDVTATAYPLSGRALVSSGMGTRVKDLDLRSMLEILIKAIADSKPLIAVGRRSKWTLWLNTSLGSAWVSWVDDAGVEHREHYLPTQPQPPLFPQLDQQPPTIVEHLMKIPFALFVVAAELSSGARNRRDTGQAESQICLQIRRGIRRTHQSGQPPRASPRNQPNSRYARGRTSP
jgi:hypothetical protein